MKVNTMTAELVHQIRTTQGGVTLVYGNLKRAIGRVISERSMDEFGIDEVSDILTRIEKFFDQAANALSEAEAIEADIAPANDKEDLKSLEGYHKICKFLADAVESKIEYDKLEKRIESLRARSK